MKVNREVGTITDNLNNCEGFTVTSQGLRDHFNTLMKRYKLKTRREVKGTNLGGEELSENEQLFEDLTERFGESEHGTEADTQKRRKNIENEKRKSQEIRKKKQWKDFEKHENISGKMKVTLGIKQSKRFSKEVVGFLREKLEQDREFRSEDLQEQNNEGEVRERQHNHLIIHNQQMQAQQNQAIQALQQQQAQILALLLQR